MQGCSDGCTLGFASGVFQTKQNQVSENPEGECSEGELKSKPRIAYRNAKLFRPWISNMILNFEEDRGRCVLGIYASVSIYFFKAIRFGHSKRTPSSRCRLCAFAAAKWYCPGLAGGKISFA